MSPEHELQMIREEHDHDLYAKRVNIVGGSVTIDPTGLATDTNQETANTLLGGIAGFTVTGYDYIALTYVAAGNGAGEIETVTFKTGGAGGTTVATLTLAYNASNEISSVTKS